MIRDENWRNGSVNVSVSFRIWKSIEEEDGLDKWRGRVPEANVGFARWEGLGRGGD